MGGFSNFAVSFTIISILSGCLTAYGFGMNTGGPVDHQHRLAARRHHDPVRRPGDGRGLLQLPDRRRPLLLVGEARRRERGRRGAGSRAGSTCWARSPSPRASTSARRSSSRVPRPAVRLRRPRRGTRSCCSASILLLHGLLNTFGVRLVALLNDIWVWWHIIGVAGHRRRAAVRARQAPVGRRSSSSTSSTTPASASDASTSS